MILGRGILECRLIARVVIAILIIYRGGVGYSREK
jgi:hypothetical protein